MTIVYLGKKYLARANIGVIAHCLENHQQDVAPTDNRHLLITHLAVEIISNSIDTCTP